MKLPASVPRVACCRVTLDPAPLKVVQPWRPKPPVARTSARTTSTGDEAGTRASRIRMRQAIPLRSKNCLLRKAKPPDEVRVQVSPSLPGIVP